MAFGNQAVSFIAICLLALLSQGCVSSSDDENSAQENADVTSFLGSDNDPPATLELDAWNNETEVGGRKLSYWDSSGCIRRNFPQLTDPAHLQASVEATDEILEALGRKLSDDQLVQNLLYPAYVAKLMCSRKWSWAAIDAVGKRIDVVNPYKVLASEDAARSADLDQQVAEETGQQRPLQMKLLIDGIVALRLTKMCSANVTIEGCELAAKVANKPGWKTAVAFAKSFDFSKDYGVSPPTPQRLLISRNPEVAIFTDHNGKLSAETIAAAPIANGNRSALSQALLELLARIDGSTLPLTANAEADNARAMLALVFLQMIEQREHMKSADPKDFADLKPLSIVFVAQARPPACGGVVADRSGFFCPNEGVIFVAANDPLKQHSARETDLYGSSLAVLVHELAHYTLHRTVSDYSPFVDEGLATATGERALAGVVAGLAYGRAHQQAALAIARLTPGSKFGDIGLAEREIQKVRTPTQVDLICIARRLPVTADEIERDLKMNPAEFQADAKRNYAVAWLVSEAMLGNAGKSAGQLTNLVKLFDLEQQFNTGMRPGTSATVRNDLQAFAAAANARLATYPNNAALGCGARRS